MKLSNISRFPYRFPGKTGSILPVGVLSGSCLAPGFVFSSALSAVVNSISSAWRVKHTPRRPQQDKLWLYFCHSPPHTTLTVAEVQVLELHTELVFPSRERMCKIMKNLWMSFITSQHSVGLVGRGRWEKVWKTAPPQQQPARSRFYRVQRADFFRTFCTRAVLWKFYFFQFYLCWLKK